MTKNKFTDEEQKILRSNPYTLSVNENIIKFTIAFKKLVIEETAKPGVTFPQVLRQAGYDPKMLGRTRIDGILINIRREAASEKGFRETGRSRESILKQDLSQKRTETSIKCLQERIAYLEQEIEFLKNFSQLPRDDNRRR